MPPPVAGLGWPHLLHQLGTQMLERRTAYRRGECLGPRGRLFSEYAMEGVYFALPVYWSDEFSVFRPPGESPIQLGWAVPVTAPEARLVHDHGWSMFEALLEEHDPDLLDLSRSSLVG